MKNLLKACLCLFWLITSYQLLVTPALAHMVGQPPYFKINGVYSLLYPVPLTSLEDFNLPQDIAAQNYLVNQELTMELDPTQLPAPPDVIKQTTFTWDFGDGTKGTGLSNQHTYVKPGSYFQLIYASDPSSPQPQIMQSTLINVLPNPNYQLPKSVIKINGKTSHDPLTDILQFNLKSNLLFDASSSTAKSSQIVSYRWDFGDRNSSLNPTITHQYTNDWNQVFPVLRVTDQNGFINDSFLEIQNNQNLAIETPPPSQKPNSPNPPFNLAFLGLICLVILLLIVIFILGKKSLK